jgi:hypothetical protein
VEGKSHVNAVEVDVVQKNWRDHLACLSCRQEDTLGHYEVLPWTDEHLAVLPGTRVNVNRGFLLLKAANHVNLKLPHLFKIGSILNK